MTELRSSREGTATRAVRGRRSRAVRGRRWGSAARWAAGVGVAALLALALTLAPGGGDPAGAYGLPEDALPPGYVALIDQPNEWPGIPSAATPTSAVAYELPGGGTVTVLAGPSEVVEGFVPDAPADEVATSAGTVRLQHVPDGRSVLVAAQADDGPTSVMIVGLGATDADLVSAFEATQAGAVPAGEVLASEQDVSVLVGGLPGQEMVYGDEAATAPIHVLTVPGASLPSVIPYLTAQGESVTLDGTEGVIFAIDGISTVVWDAGDSLVFVVGPEAVGDGVMLRLAERAEVVG